MKKLIFLILVFVLSSFAIPKTDTTTGYSIIASLKSIDYYQGFGCSVNAPILVRVTFKIQNVDVKELKMMIKFDNNIVHTMPVKEIDENGDVVYSFCTKKDKEVAFFVTFVKPNGDKSNEIKVKTSTKFSDVKTETPPVVFSLR